MCTVKEIREAIREECRSQHDMETADIDRIFQTLPFSQRNSLLDKPPMPKRPAGKKNRNRDRHNSFYRSVAFFIP